MDKNKRALKKIRRAILRHLDRTGWKWNQAVSLLLDQVDRRLNEG